MAKISQIKLGSTTYDIGAAWGNITGKPSSFPPSSHNHDFITYKDTRSDNQSPDDVQAGLTVHLKANGTDGISDGGSYHAILNVKDWGDYSGGPYWQSTVTANNNMYFRRSTAGTTWGSWQKVLSDNNYTDYTVTKTGGGASGTWGINVTGSAGSVAWGNITGKPSTFTPSSHNHDGTYAKLTSPNNLIHSGNEFTFASDAFSGDLYINYRTANNAQNGNITAYRFCKGAGGTLSNIVADTFIGKLNGNADTATYANSAGSVAWANVTGKPSTFTPSSHTHDYIAAKGNYTFNASTLPNSFDLGVSAGFVSSDSGFGNYGSVLTARTYSGGGGTLQLYAPYSPTYGGTRLKARFGNYDSGNGNSWTDLKELAWTSDLTWNNISGKPSAFNPDLPLRLKNYSTSGYASVNDATEQGFHYITGATSRPSFSTTNATDYRVLTTAYSNAWLQQIATDFRCNDIFYRRKENGTWKSWVQIQTTESADARYVKKSGDTMTGSLTIGNGADLNLQAPSGSSDSGDLVFKDGSSTEIGRIWLNASDFCIRYSSSDASKIILTSGNYTNYAPTKTGGGASGTWGINITGSAASVSSKFSVDTSRYNQVITWYNSDGTTQHSYIGAHNTGNSTGAIIINPVKDAAKDNWSSDQGLYIGKTALKFWGTDVSLSTHTHDYMPKNPGSIEMFPGTSAGHGGYIDFHYNSSSSDYTSRIIEGASGTLTINGANITGGKVYGAVWNDYAEYRTQKEKIEPGYCVASADDGQVYKTTEKFQACDGIVSDTFGFAIGETDNCRTPLAVAGRVLAYCEGDRYDYHSGDTVCAGPEGKVCKMTREEIREWPDRIVGIVSEIPEYETWGTGNIQVNGRIWIKVK